MNPSPEQILKTRIEGVMARLTSESGLFTKAYYEEMLTLISEAHDAVANKHDLLLARDKLQEATEASHAHISELQTLRRTHDAMPTQHSPLNYVKIANELKALEYIAGPLADMVKFSAHALRETPPTPMQVAEKMRRMAHEVTQWELLDSIFRGDVAFRLSHCAELATHHHFKELGTTLDSAADYCDLHGKDCRPEERNSIIRLRETLREIRELCSPTRTPAQAPPGQKQSPPGP
jgi:hypothetical protein